MNKEIRELAARIININPQYFETPEDVLQEVQWLAGKILALASKE